MINCMIDEIKIRLPYLRDQIIETIYFGGGTPSLLSTTELTAILAKIRSHYSIASEVEITMESNPDDISKESLVEWKSVGINRLSIGLQSFREEDLKWMNRAHSKMEALNCVVLAKEAGFNNISIDLIYGLPNFTLNDWKANIETALSFGIQHVSAYCLTVEDKTVLSKWVEQKKIKLLGWNNMKFPILLFLVIIRGIIRIIGKESIISELDHLLILLMVFHAVGMFRITENI